MRHLSLNLNCAAKRSQNLQISEFIKARENSNIFYFVYNSKKNTCMYSLVSFQMRTLGVDLRTTGVIAKMDPSFL